MPDTVFRSITFRRHSERRDADGNTAFAPTPVIVTYNLNVSSAAQGAGEMLFDPEQEPGCDEARILSDIDKQSLVDTYLRAGATYVDMAETLLPGYVVETEGDKGKHAQFFTAIDSKKNDGARKTVPHSFVHWMANKDGAVIPFGKEMRAPYRSLTEDEIAMVETLLEISDNGRTAMFPVRPVEKPDFLG